MKVLCFLYQFTFLMLLNILKQSVIFYIYINYIKCIDEPVAAITFCIQLTIVCEIETVNIA